MLIALLVLPFYMPVLIFGAGAAQAAAAGLPWGPQIAVLGSLFSLAAALGPFAIGGALRISVDA
jgi:heme exporter protein B